jgi:hypothetical protein
MRCIDDIRQAAISLFDSVVAVLDCLIEPRPAIPAKAVEDDAKEAKTPDPIDPTLFNFI